MSALLVLIHHDSQPWWKPRWQWLHTTTDGQVRYGVHWLKWRARGVGSRSQRTWHRPWLLRLLPSMAGWALMAAIVAVPITLTGDDPWWRNALIVTAAYYALDCVYWVLPRVFNLRGRHEVAGDWDETVGRLHDWLPPDVWVELPEHGVRVKRLGGAS